MLDIIGNKLSEIKMGPPNDFQILTAVIHRDAFERLKNAIQDAKSSRMLKFYTVEIVMIQLVIL